jgi:hypothetical protein
MNGRSYDTDPTESHSLGMRCGLAVCLPPGAALARPARGRLREADRGLTPGESRSWSRHRRCADQHRRRDRRQATVPRLGRDPPRPATGRRRPRGSGLRPVLGYATSIPSRGGGPGRGPFGPRGARQRTRPSMVTGKPSTPPNFGPSSRLRLMRCGRRGVDRHCPDRHAPRGGSPRPRSSVQVTRFGPTMPVTAKPRIGSNAGFHGASVNVSSCRMTASLPVGVAMARS